MLREALKSMGRADLIGNGKKHLIPYWQPEPGSYRAHRKKNRNKEPESGTLLTQHTGLPPREGTNTDRDGAKKYKPRRASGKSTGASNRRTPQGGKRTGPKHKRPG